MKEPIVLFFTAIFIGLSQTAGSGGGPIINVCLMFIYPSKMSISLTYIFLIGGSLASIWKNSTRMNPETNKTYVNLDIILITLPIMNSGAMLGSVLKGFLSDFTVMMLFVVLFIAIIYDIVKNIRKNNEKNKETGSRVMEITNYAVRSGDSPTKIKPSYSSTEASDGYSDSPYTKELIPSIKQGQEKMNKIGWILGMSVGCYVMTVLVSLSRGGSYYVSIFGIDSCGAIGWGLLIVDIVISVIACRYIAHRIQKERLLEEEENKFDQQCMHEISLSSSSINKYMIAGLFAGVMGSTLGIGGGPILIPIWLSAGIDKEVASSSTATLILTSATIAFTITAFNGTYDELSIWKIIMYMLLAFVSSAIIKEILTFITVKYDLKSLVLYLLLFVVVLSLCVLLPFQIREMVIDLHSFMHYGSFC